MRPSTPAGHLPLFMSLMIDGTSKVQGERNRMYSNCRAAALTRRAFLLKCSAKVQKKIIQTKFFANYFSIILGYKHPQKEVILPGWLRSSIRSATTARLVGYGHLLARHRPVTRYTVTPLHFAFSYSPCEIYLLYINYNIL